MIDKSSELKEANERLKRFLTGRTDALIFTHTIDHPSKPTGFCFCDDSIVESLKMCFRGWLLEMLLRLPFDRPKLLLLRRFGARIGKNVHIAAGAWVDPLYPQLLTIEDNVLIGSHTRLFFHEFSIDEFRVGKVIIRRGALVGGSALIRCGVEIGAGSTVAGGTVLGRNVPPGATVGGNPARLFTPGKEKTY
jgi:UDP-3-O-[3-hydroxymyristoyl] glucosamine N-acyltransferase